MTLDASAKPEDDYSLPTILEIRRSINKEPEDETAKE